MGRYKSTYPPNWHSISEDIRWLRAKGRCEKCGAIEGVPYVGRRSIVHLSVHHIGIPRPDGRLGSPKDKGDCRPENLIALCQRCHLNADRQLHAANRKANHERKLRERAAARGFVQLELPF